MRIKYTVKSIGLLLLLFITAVNHAAAGDTLAVTSRLYHVDRNKNIIIINQEINYNNTTSSNLKSHIYLDQAYELTHPTRHFYTDSSYQVSLANSAYTLYFTQLPIIRINTTHSIIDTLSVYAQFTMVEGNGAITQSNLGIETRGGSSQANPKKSYELSFWTDTLGVVDRDVRLLNMREDNKWNLQALYNEPLRVNSKIANELWLDIHEIYYKALEPDAKNGIAMTHVELFVNEEYKGVYALSERIDRKQLKLKKYNNGIKGELYKGYTWDDAVTFTGLPSFTNSSSVWGGFEYKHPEEETDWTNLYNFVDFVENSSNQDFYRTYQQRFKLDNAVDYYVLLNLLRATDNTGKNTYIAKYKSGEPYYYVPWDLDGGFGNDWQGLNVNVTDDILSNGFYDRLNRDCSPGGFRAKLIERWTELRENIITEDYILAKFRTNSNYLLHNRVYEREHIAWDTYAVDTTQLSYVRTWVRNRLSYLDVAFNQPCIPLSATSVKQGTELKLYPNPTSDYLMVESDPLPFELCIQDVQGRVVLKTNMKGSVNRVDLHLMPKGIYIVTLKNNEAIQTKRLIVN